MPNATFPLDRALTGLKAVADEKRLGIIASLAGGERCVCELQESLGAGQSLLSFHLKTLKEAGLVNDRREGRWVYYSLDREVLGELEAFFRDARTAETAFATAPRCCDRPAVSRIDETEDSSSPREL